jgi:hypothetical protein
LIEALLKRYNERRNGALVAILTVLTTNQFPKSTKDFRYPSRQDIISAAAKFCPERVEEEELEVNEAQGGNLGKMIEGSIQPKVKALNHNLQSDFALLESHGKLSNRLLLVKKALSSMKPTSTCCEQSSSIASNLKTKQRNRMGTSRLNALTWLKKYFKSQTES